MNFDIAELDDRITKCQKILDADPNSQIFAALADAYRKKGVIPKALEVCKKGLEVHPDYASAYVVLAKIFIDQNNFEEADRQIQKAIHAGGRTRSVDLLQSEILIKLGQPNKARVILEKLHKSDPGSDTIKSLLETLESAAAEPAKRDDSISIVPSSAKRNYTLTNALSIIKILPRILGVVAVAKDGMVIEGHFDGMLSKDDLGALASGAFDSICQGIEKINIGRPDEILIETDQSKLWICNYDKMLIVISMRDDANLGSLRLKVNEIFGHTDFS